MFKPNFKVKSRNMVTNNTQSKRKKMNVFKCMWDKLKSCSECTATEIIGREVIDRNERFGDECGDVRDTKIGSRLKM